MIKKIIGDKKAKDTVIVLGDSPFLEEIKWELQYILERYYSIGINNVITKFFTNEHIFVDAPFVPLTNKFIGKTVTLRTYEGLIPKENKYLIDTFSFDFNKHSHEDICSNDKVAWCGFTHDYAVSYCIKQKYKRIILIGAADFSSGSHFSNSHNFKFSYILRENSKRFIEDYASKVIKIETCNPDSYLKIPRVSINELLK